MTVVRRSEIWKSLRTDSKACAVRRLPVIAAQVESEFERLRHEAGLTVDMTLLGPLADDLRMFARSVGETADASAEVQLEVARPTLGEIYQRYIDDPTHAWTASTRQAYETTRAVAVGVLGADTSITTLSRADVRGLIDILRFLPRNSTKLFPKLPLRDAAARARSHPSITRISTSNANAYLGNFSSFLNWCVDEECQSACKRDPLSARKRDPLSGWRNVDVESFLALRAA